MHRVILSFVSKTVPGWFWKTFNNVWYQQHRCICLEDLTTHNKIQNFSNKRIDSEINLALTKKAVSFTEKFAKIVL